MKPVFSLFVGRTQSLLEHWQRLYDEQSKGCSDEELQVLQDRCLLGLVSEISDPCTQALIDEVTQRISE